MDGLLGRWHTSCYSSLRFTAVQVDVFNISLMASLLCFLVVLWFCCLVLLSFAFAWFFGGVWLFAFVCAISETTRDITVTSRSLLAHEATTTVTASLA